MNSNSNDAQPARKLTEIFGVFSRLGATAFGGPAAHIALMEAEFVERRKWLSRERFLDLLGAAYLIPGPTSTELALFLGRERGGIAGLFAAGIGFIWPALALVLLIAAFSTGHDSSPHFQAMLRGIQPVVIAIVAQALVSLLRTALKSSFLILCALAVAAGAIFSPYIALLIFGAGFLNMAARRIFPVRQAGAKLLWLLCGWCSGRRASAAGELPAALALATAPSAGALFWSFFKMGALFYGSGYVLLSFLHADFVLTRHWLTETQLTTAIAVGQFTPGPLFTTSTYIGYQLQGWSGALAATAGIFAPAFGYAILCGMLVERVRKSAAASAFLDGVNAASCALMAVVTCQLGTAAIVDWRTALLGIASAAVLIRFKLNATWLVLAGGLAGLAGIV